MKISNKNIKDSMYIFNTISKKKKLQQIYIEQKSSESFSQGQSNPSKIGSI